jgi:hypothetical protein
VATSTAAILGVGQLSSASTDETGDPTLSVARASDPTCALVNTDLGEPFSCSYQDGSTCSWGLSGCLREGASLPGELPSLRGYGCVGFLFGRGGGIRICGATAAPLPSPEDSRVTCRVQHKRRSETLDSAWHG